MTCAILIGLTGCHSTKVDMPDTHPDPTEVDTPSVAEIVRLLGDPYVEVASPPELSKLRKGMTAYEVKDIFKNCKLLVIGLGDVIGMGDHYVLYGADALYKIKNQKGEYIHYDVSLAFKMKLPGPYKKYADRIPPLVPFEKDDPNIKNQLKPLWKLLRFNVYHYKADKNSQDQPYSYPFD